MNVIKIKSYTFSIIFSMFTLFVYSRMFIVSLFNSNLSICPKILSLLLVYSLLFLFHSIIFTKKTYKIFLYIFCFLNSLSMYFMDTYHVMINKDTIINLIETNINEVQGFINFRLFLYLIIFCVLILIFIIKFVNINFLDFKKEIKYKIYSIIVFLFSSTLILLDKNYLYEIRENKILVNVPLHGCCIIFSKKYVNKYTDVFYNETFLFYEEEFLYQRILKDNLISVYDNKLEIFHKEGASVKKVGQNIRKSRLFREEKKLESLILLKNYISS